MLRHWLKPAVLLAILVLVPGVGIGGEPWPSAKTVVENVPELGPQTSPATGLVGGEVAVLFLNPEGRVAFRRGERVQILDEGTERTGGKRLTLHDDGQRLYAVWWNKLTDGNKRLYLRVSADRGESFGPLVTLNSSGGVLPTYEVAADGAGRIAVAYHDERKPLYQIYLNRSLDGGKTWLDQDVRLDSAPWADREQKIPPPQAVEPKLVFHGPQLVAVWRERRSGEEGKSFYRLVSRVSADGGQTWAPEVEVYRNDQQYFTADVLLSHQDQLLLVGFQPDQGLLAFRSADAGRSWQSLGALPGSAAAKTISQTRAVASGDKVLVAYTLEQNEQKPQVHLATLSASQGQWRPTTQRLDRGKETELTKAVSPDLAALPDGMVVSVWEDYRDILPAIYLDYSVDGGQTWQERPQPVTEPGRYPAMAPWLAVTDKALLVFFDQFHDAAARQRRDLVYQSLPWDKSRLTLPAAAGSLSEAEKRQRLLERAEQFWRLREQGKSAELYPFFDPVFRSGVSEETFVKQQGKIIYKDVTVSDPEMAGNLGGVKVTATFSLAEERVMGRPVKQREPQTETFNNQWVWVYDNWYVVPRALLGGKSHLPY